MQRTFEKHMKQLDELITGVVRRMRPTMICMCEVGDTSPLSEEQMQQVADRCIRNWTAAATEHIQLRSMFTAGAPYITIYILGPIQCSEHRILQDLSLIHI